MEEAALALSDNELTITVLTHIFLSLCRIFLRLKSSFLAPHAHSILKLRRTAQLALVLCHPIGDAAIQEILNSHITERSRVMIITLRWYQQRQDRVPREKPVASAGIVTTSWNCSAWLSIKALLNGNSRWWAWIPRHEPLVQLNRNSFRASCQSLDSSIAQIPALA